MQANFYELHPNISQWTTDEEDLFIRKLKQMTDNYVSQAQEINASLSKLTDDLEKVEINYHSKLNCIKNMSIRKFVEQTINDSEIRAPAVEKPEPVLLSKEEREINLLNKFKSAITISLENLNIRNLIDIRDNDKESDLDDISVSSSRYLNYLNKGTNEKLKLPHIIGNREFFTKQYLGVAFESSNFEAIREIKERVEENAEENLAEDKVNPRDSTPAVVPQENEDANNNDIPFKDARLLNYGSSIPVYKDDDPYSKLFEGETGLGFIGNRNDNPDDANHTKEKSDLNVRKDNKNEPPNRISLDRFISQKNALLDDDADDFEIYDKNIPVKSSKGNLFNLIPDHSTEIENKQDEKSNAPKFPDKKFSIVEDVKDRNVREIIANEKEAPKIIKPNNLFSVDKGDNESEEDLVVEKKKKDVLKNARNNLAKLFDDEDDEDYNPLRSKDDRNEEVKDKTNTDDKNINLRLSDMLTNEKETKKNNFLDDKEIVDTSKKKNRMLLLDPIDEEIDLKKSLKDSKANKKENQKVKFEDIDEEDDIIFSIKKTKKADSNAGTGLKEGERKMIKESLNDLHNKQIITKDEKTNDPLVHIDKEISQKFTNEENAKDLLVHIDNENKQISTQEGKPNDFVDTTNNEINQNKEIFLIDFASSDATNLNKSVQKEDKSKNAFNLFEGLDDLVIKPSEKVELNESQPKTTDNNNSGLVLFKNTADPLKSNEKTKNHSNKSNIKDELSFKDKLVSRMNPIITNNESNVGESIINTQTSLLEEMLTTKTTIKKKKPLRKKFDSQPPSKDEKLFSLSSFTIDDKQLISNDNAKELKKQTNVQITDEVQLNKKSKTKNKKIKLAFNDDNSNCEKDKNLISEENKISEKTIEYNEPNRQSKNENPLISNNTAAEEVLSNIKDENKNIIIDSKQNTKEDESLPSTIKEIIGNEPIVDQKKTKIKIEDSAAVNDNNTHENNHDPIIEDIEINQDTIDEHIRYNEHTDLIQETNEKEIIENNIDTLKEIRDIKDDNFDTNVPKSEENAVIIDKDHNHNSQNLEDIHDIEPSNKENTEEEKVMKTNQTDIELLDECNIKEEVKEDIKIEHAVNKNEHETSNQILLDNKDDNKDTIKEENIKAASAVGNDTEYDNSNIPNYYDDLKEIKNNEETDKFDHLEHDNIVQIDKIPSNLDKPKLELNQNNEASSCKEDTYKICNPQNIEVETQNYTDIENPQDLENLEKTVSQGNEKVAIEIHQEEPSKPSIEENLNKEIPDSNTYLKAEESENNPNFDTVVGNHAVLSKTKEYNIRNLPSIVSENIIKTTHSQDRMEEEINNKIAEVKEISIIPNELQSEIDHNKEADQNTETLNNKSNKKKPKKGSLFLNFEDDDETLPTIVKKTEEELSKEDIKPQTEKKETVQPPEAKKSFKDPLSDKTEKVKKKKTSNAKDEETEGIRPGKSSKQNKNKKITLAFDD